MDKNMFPQIRRCFETDAVYYTTHAKNEMMEEALGRISDEEVYETILSGEIIENYHEDKPYPSCLIYGNTRRTRPLHVVCAYNKQETMVIIITVYEPDSARWINYKRRKQI